MKRNKFFLMAVATLGLAACNSNDAPAPDTVGEGNAFAKMNISMVQSGETRAIADGQEDYNGRDPESKLATLDLLSSVKNFAWAPSAADGTGFWEVGTSKTFTVAPWKTQAGSQAMALLLNKNTTATATIGEAKTKELGSSPTAIKDIAALSTESAFVMTSATTTNNVVEGVTAAQVKAGTDATKNVFAFDAERVVTQGMVAKDAALGEGTKDGQGKVDLTALTYSAVNGAAKTFLFRDNAGSRTMATATPYAYGDFKSAIHAYQDYQAAQDPTAAVANLIRLGNLASAAAGKTNDDLGGYKAIGVSTDATAAKAARGIYFLENSVDKSSTWTSANKDFGFYRLAYAKVYTTYTPNQVYYLDGTTLKTKAGDKGKTFYKGATDGLLYETVAAAKASQIAPKQKVYTYTNGRCAYRALWNRQGDTVADVFTLANADTRRNNVYLLTIEAFQGLGMAWDSSDPNDPNLPKPKDPKDEGENPDDPDVEKQDTYMRVTAKVLPWNLVTRKVILD